MREVSSLGRRHGGSAAEPAEGLGTYSGTAAKIHPCDSYRHLKPCQCCRLDNSVTMSVRVQAVTRQQKADVRRDRKGDEESQKQRGVQTDGAEEEESSHLLGGNLSSRL